MGIPSGWELVLVVVVIVLLFGARKLPDAARGLGRSLRIFKAEIKDPNDEEGRDLADGTTTPTAQQAPPVIAPPPVLPVQQVLPAQPPAVPVEPKSQPSQQSPTDR